MGNVVKKNLFSGFLMNYTDVPKGTGLVIPLIVIESVAMCISFLISIYLVRSLHFNSYQVGKLISVMSLGTCVGSLLSGYLTTKISVMKVSALGLYIYSIGFILLSNITLYFNLLFVLFLCGLGGVFMMIGNLTALIKIADQDEMKNRIIVLQSVVFNLSLSVCGFFMSYLQNDSIRRVFLILGVFLFLAGIFVQRISCISNSYIKIKKKSLSALKLSIPFTSMIISIIFFYGMIYSLVKIYFPIEAVSRFHNPFGSWLILSINPLMIIFFQPFIIGKLKNINNITLLILGAIFLGFGYALFGITKYLILNILFLILATTGEMIFSPISKKIAATSLGSGNEGLGLAAWKMTYYFSGILGSILVGYLGENYQSLNIWTLCIPFTLAIILCVACYNVYLKKADFLITT